jgi:hypothetical protein
MASLFSDIVDDDAQWGNPDADYAALLAVVGGAALSNSPVTKAALLNTAVNTPVGCAFTLTGETGHIYVGYQPTAYPSDITAPNVYDGQVAMLIGNDLTVASMVVVPDVAFARCGDTNCYDLPYLAGVHGYGLVGGAAFRHAIPAGGAPGTGNLRSRPIMLLPRPVLVTALTTQPNGHFTILGFYNSIIAPYVAGTAAEQALIGPVAEWFRLMVMDTGAGASVLGSAATVSAAPIVQQALQRHRNSIAGALLSRLGVGGPALSTAAFNAGVNTIGVNMTDNNDAQLQYFRDRDNKTFSQKHGDALAQRMYNWCGVADDAGLPELHQLLAKSPKNRDYSIINAQIQARVTASAVPLTLASAPLMSTKLVDQVFRSLNPSGSGVEFAAHLSPFAIVCEGHAEYATVLDMVKQAELAESGSTMSLADASRLTTTDVRFPSQPQHSAEKLYGWSLGIDLFHGSNQPVADSTRNFVIGVGPALHRVHDQHLDNPALGMDLVCRVMFEAQQEYFMWANAVAVALPGGVAAVPLPDYARLTNAVLTYRADSLSPLPGSWYRMFGNPGGATGRRSVEERVTSPRAQAGAAPTFNAHADSRLMRRFEDSTFPSITALMEGHDVAIPQLGGKEICLVWALKGKCSRTCKRKGMHKSYPRAVVTQVHALLDTCGVVADN